MHWILCLDDKNGMSFNRRRQSKDRILREHLLAFLDGRKLWMSPYSAAQFDTLPDDAEVDEDYLAHCGVSDFCFVETGSWTSYLAQADQIVVYRWNRVYPADTRFPEEELQRRTCISSMDFPGSSHDVITQEVYIL